MDRVEIFYQLFVSPAQVRRVEGSMIAAALAVARQSDPAAHCSSRAVRRASEPGNALRSKLFRRSDNEAALVQQWTMDHPDQPAGDRAVFTVAATVQGTGLAARRGEMYWAVLETVSPQARSAEVAYQRGQHTNTVAEDITWAGGVYLVPQHELDERLVATA